MLTRRILNGRSIYDGSNIANAWTTFSPDTTRIVAASKGILTLRDGDTGAPIGANTGAIPLGGTISGTMPDWAPDGKHLLFAQTPGTKGKDRSLKSSSIGWVSISGDTFANAEVLLQSASDADNYAYPMFNPTSDFIAFARGNEDTDNDKTSQIGVAPARAGVTAQQQQLVRADTLVNDVTVATGIQNSMPTWAPTSADGIQWVAFTSTRDYGGILADGSSYGKGHDQLWVAAVDTAKLGTTSDPSFPAFRVPFLDLTENCHRPFWAEDAFVSQPDAGAGDAGDPGPCVTLGGDCTSGTCCTSPTFLSCAPDTDDKYVCKPPIK